MDYTSEQIEIIVEARNKIVEHMADIDMYNVYIKALLNNLYDDLGLTKDDKEAKKAIANGFKMFYNESKDEVKSLTDKSVEIAEM